MLRTVSVDGGNTKLKLGLLSLDMRSIEITREVTIDTFEHALKELCITYKLPRINLALTTVVQSTKEAILSYAERSPLIDSFHYVTAKENQILQINYDRQMLGSDRLAAAIAAQYLSQSQEIIIIDSGTATKVDMVQKGTFIGGFILPGLGIKAQALFEKTDKLPQTDVYAIHYTDTPLITTEAIESGLIIDSLGGIEKAIEVCKKHLSRPFIIATGGGWNILKEYSNTTEIQTIPNLALLGAGISMKLSNRL